MSLHMSAFKGFVFNLSLVILAQLVPISMAHAGPSSQGGRVAAVSKGWNNVEAFWIDDVGAVNHSYSNGNGWGSEMFAPAGTANTSGSITAMVRQSQADTPEVFWAKGNTLQHSVWVASASAWTTPGPVAASINNVLPRGGISAVSRASNTMEVFYVGTDYAIWHTYWYEGGTWSAASPLTPAGSVYHSGTTASSIAAISRRPNTMEVFYVDSAQELAHINYYDGANPVWSPTSTQPPLTGRNKANPFAGIAVASRDSSKIEVFFENFTGALQHVYWSEGNQWSAASPLTNNYVLAYRSSIAAVTRWWNTMEVFFVGADSNLQHVYWYDGSNWSAPGIVLDPANHNNQNVPYARAPGGVGAVSWSSLTIDVLYLEQNNYKLHGLNYTDGVNNWADTPVPPTFDGNWPSLSAYTLVGDNPTSDFNADWTNDLQGIAHSSSMWYITHGSTAPSPDTQRQVCKVPLSEPITNFGSWLQDLCYTMDAGHLGDLDYYAGKLFVPWSLEGGGEFLSVLTDQDPYDYTQKRYISELVTSMPANMAWVAVNPREGRLYAPVAYDLSVLKTFDIILPPVSATVTLQPGPDLYLDTTIPAVQGGVFSPNGHLYLVSDPTTDSDWYRGGIYGVDVSNGQVGYASQLVQHGQAFPYNPDNCCDFFCTYSCPDEPEGIDYIDLDANSYGTGLTGMGQLHVQVLNNNWPGDDSFSFYHYRVSSGDI